MIKIHEKIILNLGLLVLKILFKGLFSNFCSGLLKKENLLPDTL